MEERRIQMTADYSMFRMPAWNRDIKEKHINKIVASIQKNGWLPKPILVNKEFEILDGQHRFEALKRLGRMVEFAVVDDVQPAVIQDLNSVTMKWNIVDHVHAEAQKGKPRAKFAMECVQKYPSIPPGSICNLVFAYQNGFLSATPRASLIRLSNACESDLIDRLKVIQILNTLMTIKNITKTNKIQSVMSVILFVDWHPELNIDRLIDKVSKYHQKMIPFTSIEEAMESFSIPYHYKTSDSKRIIDYYREEHKKMMSANGKKNIKITNQKKREKASSDEPSPNIS